MVQRQNCTQSLEIELLIISLSKIFKRMISYLTESKTKYSHLPDFLFRGHLVYDIEFHTK